MDHYGRVATGEPVQSKTMPPMAEPDPLWTAVLSVGSNATQCAADLRAAGVKVTHTEPRYLTLQGKKGTLGPAYAHRAIVVITPALRGS
jgi:hypothetical protein